MTDAERNRIWARVTGQGPDRGLDDLIRSQSAQNALYRRAYRSARGYARRVLGSCLQSGRRSLEMLQRERWLRTGDSMLLPPPPPERRPPSLRELIAGQEGLLDGFESRGNRPPWPGLREAARRCLRSLRTIAESR